MRLLVVGGAGYVGATAAMWLRDRGHAVWVLDDLSTGHRDFVPDERFTEARVGDREALEALFARERFDGVMHFAARSLVGESVQKPEEYFENNVLQTQVLLEAMLEHGIERFLFSSTAAVFGTPSVDLITEDSPKAPINPYGETKLEVERRLEQLASTRGLRAIALRYFNAAGAEPGLRVGERHEPETHLIPSILAAASQNRAVQLFGDDYPTPDGTCVRDYVHVRDLAVAHEAAMLRLAKAPAGFEAFNLGSQSGHSVLEVIRACERVVGRPIPVERKPRRAGDPPRLVADSRLARKELGFKIDFPLERIVETAWGWEQKNRFRFG